MISRLTKKYDYYFFINTSVRGPFLIYDNKKDWVFYFIQLLGKETRLAGTTINIFKTSHHKIIQLYGKKKYYSHVQSMFFVMDQILFDFLQHLNFFNEKEINKKTNMLDIIIEKEIGLSQIALNQNWNINCILDKYRDIDYRVLEKDINQSSYNGDAYLKNKYFGDTIDPYYVIFFKNNRW
jgi:hypothetical protein